MAGVRRINVHDRQAECGVRAMEQGGTGWTALTMQARSSKGNRCPCGAAFDDKGDFMSLRDAMRPARRETLRVHRRSFKDIEIADALRRRRQDQGSTRNGRRLAAASLCGAAVVALGAAGPGPAVASTGPSVTVNGNSVNIAIQGPNHSLKFYWANNGTSTWHAETIAGAGTTYSAPAMTVNGNAVNIAAMGPDHRLKFYWAVNGTPTWHPETVAGTGSTYSAPAMTVDHNSVNISAVGPRNRLKFYWAVNGTPTWHPETVAGIGSVS